VVRMPSRTYNVILALSLIAVFAGIITLTFYHSPQVNATTTVSNEPVIRNLRNGDAFVVSGSITLTFTGSSEWNGMATPTFTFACTTGIGAYVYAFPLYVHYYTPFHYGGKTFKVTDYDSGADTVIIEEIDG